MSVSQICAFCTQTSPVNGMSSLPMDDGVDDQNSSLVCEIRKNKLETYDSLVLRKQTNIEKQVQILTEIIEKLCVKVESLEAKLCTISNNCSGCSCKDSNVDKSFHNNNNAPSPTTSANNNGQNIGLIACQPPQRSSLCLHSDPSKCGNQILANVMKDLIKIDDTELAANKVVVSALTEALSAKLKENDVTQRFFKNYIYTGSSYENLRIKNAGEFDINVVLDMPKQYKSNVEFFGDGMHFVKLKWELSSGCTDVESVLKFLNDHSHENYLMSSKILAWMQSTTDRIVIDDFCNHENIAKIHTSESGPARTIKIDKSNGSEISIDLVPVFRVRYKTLPERQQNILLEYSENLPESQQIVLLVPKLCKVEELNGTMSRDDCELSWRLQIPNIENKILHAKLCAKPIIKLLKWIRDKECWSQIASYYLKNLMILEVQKNPAPEYWSIDVFYERFLEVLRAWMKCMREKNLPYFFDHSHNLIGKLKPLFSENCHRRIQKWVSQLEKDHEYLKEIFSL